MLVSPSFDARGKKKMRWKVHGVLWVRISNRIEICNAWSMIGNKLSSSLCVYRRQINRKHCQNVATKDVVALVLLPFSIVIITQQWRKLWIICISFIGVAPFGGHYVDGEERRSNAYVAKCVDVKHVERNGIKRIRRRKNVLIITELCCSRQPFHGRFYAHRSLRLVSPDCHTFLFLRPKLLLLWRIAQSDHWEIPSLARK